MPLEIRKSVAAATDLLEIWDFTLERWGEAQADKYLRLLDRTIESLRAGNLIATGPLVGRFRRIRAQRHHIYYEVLGETVEIVRVLHVSMDAVRHLGTPDVS